GAADGLADDEAGGVRDGDGGAGAGDVAGVGVIGLRDGRRGDAAGVVDRDVSVDGVGAEVSQGAAAVDGDIGGRGDLAGGTRHGDGSVVEGEVARDHEGADTEAEAAEVERALVDDGGADVGVGETDADARAIGGGSGGDDDIAGIDRVDDGAGRDI